MYNENDEQLFIKIDPDKDSVEFLLMEQPLEMIKAGIVSKFEIREAVEIGRQDVINIYSRAFPMQTYNIVMNVYVQIDKFLQTIESVEKRYF